MRMLTVALIVLALSACGREQDRLAKHTLTLVCTQIVSFSCHVPPPAGDGLCPDLTPKEVHYSLDTSTRACSVNLNGGCDPGSPQTFYAPDSLGQVQIFALSACTPDEN